MTKAEKGIAGAWVGYRRMFLRVGASKREHDDMRQAFYSGAAVLFAAMINGVAGGTEPTADDLRFMSDLDDELREFGVELDAKYGIDRMRTYRRTVH